MLRTTSPGDRPNGVFDDPSKTMQHGSSNATAVVTENSRLRESIRVLEEENERLKKYVEQQHQKEVEAAAKKKNDNQQTHRSGNL